MNVSPLRTIDGLVNKDLTDLRDWYFRLLVSCGVAVGIGVFLEAPEILHETWDAIRETALRRLWRIEATGFIPTWILREYPISPWIKMAGLLGACPSNVRRA